jgi:transposase InsO family protein
VAKQRRSYTSEFKVEAVKKAENKAAGYYAWLSRPPSFQERRREALLVLIRGIHAALAAGGEACGVNTVARLMRDNGIRAKSARRFRRTTDSNHHLPGGGRRPEPPVRCRGQSAAPPTRYALRWQLSVFASRTRKAILTRNSEENFLPALRGAIKVEITRDRHSFRLLRD